MIIIRFPDPESERRGLGFLANRYSCTSWSNGETLVPEAALADLAHEGIRYIVEGPATNGHGVPAVRNPTATPV
jgi:hypothetical protein